ncbi:MAG: TIGR03752 family integrating conjugative element protein [Woeseia sp.]
MLITRQNRLLPLLAAIVILMLILVLGRSCSRDEQDRVLLDRVPQVSRPDADTPADTIKTLTANVAAMTSELQSLRQANIKLRTDNESLEQSRKAIDDSVALRIDREFAQRDEERRSADDQALSSMNERIETLADALRDSAMNREGSDMPVGLGWDPFVAGTELKWIDPLDVTTDNLRDELLTPRRPGPSNAWTPAAGPADDPHAENAVAATPRPVYTVPRNATLMGSTAMTALLGRVPIRGEVRDPMPFKVITGRDNLAANGLTVPGVEGMIWSGTAIGDWTLSCVTGRLESVTFVFDDGSIRTLSTDDREERSGERNRPLGWISDARGIPCVSGERKSNAAAFLSQRIGAKAIEAAADAAAASQTTTVLRDSGGISNTVSGDTGAYVLGNTVAEGGNEIAEWLLERQAQNFDAVFVPAGAELAIHVDRQLTIDLDPHGRRLNHAMPQATPNPGQLD